MQQVNRLAISLNKQYLAAAGNPHVRIYDCRSQKESPLLSFEEHTSNVTGIAFHRKAAWTATSSEDGTVKIWDLRCPHAQKDYNHGCAVNDVVIHPNQDEVISCDQGGCVKIWDLRENVNTHTLIPEEDVPARSVAVANDGRMLIAGNNKVLFQENLVEDRAIFMFGKWSLILKTRKLYQGLESRPTIHTLLSV